MFPLFLLLFHSVLPLNSTQDSTRLTQHLLSNHQRASAPGHVTVHHEIEIIHILHVDEKKQSMRVFVYLTKTWRDPTLSWIPDLFGNLTRTWLPIRSVWVPEVLIVNMLERQDIMEDIRLAVRITSEGDVTSSVPLLVTVMCSIQISAFPFDNQQCAIEIAPWGYAGNEFRLVLSNMSHYKPNEEWELTDVWLERHESVVDDMLLLVRITRKPLFFITSLILPTYIISSLSIIGLFSRFSTKLERQERYTLGVMSTLTLAVLSLAVAEKVPHTSDEIPFLVKFFHVNIIMVALSTLATSIGMSVEGKPNSLAHWIFKLPRMSPSVLPESKRMTIIRKSEKLDSILFCVFGISITIPFVLCCYKCYKA